MCGCFSSHSKNSTKFVILSSNKGDTNFPDARALSFSTDFWTSAQPD